MELFGQVPYMQTCTAVKSVLDCRHEMFARENAMIDSVGSLWRALRDSLLAIPGTTMPALNSWEAISDSALSRLDPGLVGNVDEAIASISAGGVFSFQFPGLEIPIHVSVAAPRVPRPPNPDTIGVDVALANVQVYASYAETPRPSLYIVFRDGDIGVVGGQVAEFLDEISRVRSDPSYDSPQLPPRAEYELRHPGQPSEPTLVVEEFVAAMPGEKCEEPGAELGIANTRWRPVRIGADSVIVSGQQREPWMVLDPRAKRVTGSGGCNSFSGSFEASRETLRFGRMVSTAMVCADMETESAFFRALEETRRYRVLGRILELLDEKGLLLARLEERNLR